MGVRVGVTDVSSSLSEFATKHTVQAIRILGENLRCMAALFGVSLAVFLVFAAFALQFPVGERFSPQPEPLEAYLPWYYFFAQNLLAFVAWLLTSIVTLGAAAVLSAAYDGVTLAASVWALHSAGDHVLLGMATAIAPHALFEVPANTFALSLSWRAGASVARPLEGMSRAESLRLRLEDFVRALPLIVALLLVGAVVEAYATPQIMRAFYPSLARSMLP